MDKYDDAVEVLNSAIALDSNQKYCWYHKGNLQLKLKNYEDAKRCYNQSIQIDNRFAEGHNQKAVIYAHNKEYKKALEEIKTSIELKPTLSVAYENLVKLTFFSEKNHQNFLEFWSATDSRKFIATSLIIFAFGLPLFYPFLFGNEIMKEREINITGQNTFQGKVSETSTNVTSIPEIYLVIIGLIILLLLSPQIKTAKAGPIHLELSTIDIDLSSSLSNTNEPHDRLAVQAP